MLVVNPVPKSWVELAYNAAVTDRSAFVVLHCRRGSSRYSYVDLRTIETPYQSSRAARELFEAVIEWIGRNGDPADAVLEAFAWKGDTIRSLGRVPARVTTEAQE